MSEQPKKVGRRNFLYAGLGAVALIAIGAAAYVAMNPPVVTQTVPTTPTTTSPTVTKWTPPSLPHERIIGKWTWLPPKEYLADVINVENPGSLKYDPATVAWSRDFTKNTGIDVNLVETAQENSNDMIVMMSMFAAKASTYDFVQPQSEGYIPQFAAAGYLEPLDDYFPEERWKEFPPVARACAVAKGPDGEEHVYGNAWLLYPWVWYYVDDVWKEAGLPLPMEGNAPYGGPPETWDELIQMAKKLTTGERYGLALDVGGLGAGWVRHWVCMNKMLGGPGLFNGEPASDTVAVDTEVGREALKLLVELNTEYKVAAPDSIKISGFDIYSRIAGKKVGMGLMYAAAGMWFKRDIGATGWGVFETPPQSKKGPTYNPGYVPVWCVNAFSPEKSKNAAKALASWISEYPSQLQELVVEGNWPAMPAIYDDPEVKRVIDWQPQMQACKKAFDHSLLQIFPLYFDVTTAFQIFDNAWTGEISVGEACKEAQEKIVKAYRGAGL